VVPLADSEYAASQIPDNQLHLIEGAGHVPTVTCPEDVAYQINQFFSNK
jgi:pimeloyl-ACP methyl ester carboxylesterase